MFFKDSKDPCLRLFFDVFSGQVEQLTVLFQRFAM